MDINKIQIFVQAIENKSLLKTAEKLGYTQSGLTHMMNSIENEYGVTLLNRGKYGIRLTEEGERLLPFFREAVKVNDKINTEVRLILQQKASIISIGAISSVIRTWLPDVIIEFQKIYPDISFEIKEGDDIMYQWFDRGDIDVCIVSNMISRDDFVPLMKDYFMAALPPDYDIKKGEKFSIADMQHEKFITPSCGHDIDVERLLAEYNVHPKNQNTYVEDSSVISMVSKGFGVSMLPRLVTENCRENIITADLDRPCFRTIGMLYKHSANISPSVSRFVSFLKKWDFKTQEQDIDHE